MKRKETIEKITLSNSEHFAGWINRKQTNLQSTVNTMWETCTQILHFSNGNKRTFAWIITSTIKQWEFTKMKLVDWRMLMVNTANIDCIEVFSDNKD